MPGLLNLDALTQVIKKNKKLLTLLIVSSLLLAVIYYFVTRYNIFKMLPKILEDKLSAFPLPTRIVFRSFIIDVINSGYDVEITSAVRTNGKDPHTRKHAIDLNIVDRKTKRRYMMNTPKADWLATGVPSLAITKHKLRWGGNFVTPYMYNGTLRKAYDPVHFDTE